MREEEEKDSQILCPRMKNFMTAHMMQKSKMNHLLLDPSNQGFPPLVSGNQPFVPPTATFMIR